MKFVETPISSRYLSQDDRIEIADGLAAGEAVKDIADRIKKSYQTVYREIARNRKPDGRYQPWYAHSQAYLRRRRPRPRRFDVDARLREAVAGKLDLHWSPQQISRWLRRRWPRRPGWTCAPKRSMKRSIAAWSLQSIRRRCGLVGRIGTGADGEEIGKAHSSSPRQ